MIDDLLRIGDEVVVTIETDTRGWGYDPCPDGTKAVVISFTESYYGRLQTFSYKPGVYVNKSWINIKLETGKEYTEWSGRLELTDKNEYEQRLVEFRKYQKENPDIWMKSEFIRDLPETKFWEGDFVRVPSRLAFDGKAPMGDHSFQIVHIDYAYINSLTDIGSQWPFYDISSSTEAGWNMAARESEMELIERGNVWKHYHNEKIEFKSLKEEARFYHSLGHTDEIRNPKTGLYRWTKDEVLNAIREGIAHGFTMSDSFFGSTSSPHAMRFRNEELGKRVAQATLEGFKEE